MSDSGKRATINVRCTMGEKAAAEARASQEGYPDVSKLVRSLLEANRGGVTQTAADRRAILDAAVQLKLVGNVLNQLIRRGNLVGKGYEAVKPALPEAQAILGRIRELEDSLRATIGEIRGRGRRRG